MVRFLKKYSWLAFISVLISNASGSNQIMDKGSWNYEIYMGGKKVGNSQITSTAVGEDRIETVSKVHFELARGQQIIQVDIGAHTVYHWPSAYPIEYDLTLTSGRVPTMFTATFSDQEAVIKVKSGPQEFEKKIPLDGNEFIADNNFLIEHYLVMLMANKLETDQSREVGFVVPQIVQRFPRVFKMKLKNLGIEGNQSAQNGLLKLEGVGTTGLRMEFWLDPDDYSLVRWSVPSQMTEVVLSKTVNEKPISPADLSEIYSHLLERYYIPSYLKMGNFKEIQALKIRLDLCVIGGEGIPESPYQSFNGEVTKNSSVLCYAGTLQNSMVEYDLQETLRLEDGFDSDQEFLSETVDYPSKSNEITSLAQELTRETSDRWSAVKAISDWVFRNIQYEITGSGALECLKTKKGDCGPKSLLTISMLRSIGIPSRLVGGLLYVGGKFGQHNWVEFEALPGQWVPLDPTTGEIERFSASHIALWQGMGALAPDARPMKIDVLAFSRLE